MNFRVLGVGPPIGIVSIYLSKYFDLFCAIRYLKCSCFLRFFSYNLDKIILVRKKNLENSIQICHAILTCVEPCRPHLFTIVFRN